MATDFDLILGSGPGGYVDAIRASQLLLGRLISVGLAISLVIPILAAAVPLAGIAVAVFAYSKTASVAKVAALVVACVLIGTANLL